MAMVLIIDTKTVFQILSFKEFQNATFEKKKEIAIDFNRICC